MDRTRTASRAVGSLVAAALVGTSLLGGLSAPGAAAARGTGTLAPLLTIRDFRPTFSPNDDGYRDRMRLPVTLRRDAWVAYEITDLRTGLVVSRQDCAIVDEGSCRAVPRGRQVLRLPRLSPSAGRTPYRIDLTVRSVARPVVDTMQAHARFAAVPALKVDRSGVQAGPDGDAVYISPNGDRVLDRLPVRMRLERRSRVTAVVYGRELAAPARVRLGVLDAGTRRWAWNAKVDGVPVADGMYHLEVRGRPVDGPPARSSDLLPVVVDTVAPDRAATVRLNRTTVYPASTAFADSIRMSVDLPASETDVAEVRTDTGKRVTRLTTRAVGSADPADPIGELALTTWFARRADGSPLPAGDYRLHWEATDLAGNHTVLPERTLTVSSAQLVERTASITWSAETAPTYWSCYMNGCGDVAPTSGPSTRFPGGVSLSRYNDVNRSWESYGHSPDLPDGWSTADRFRVTATGGPTTPGAADVTTLAAHPWGPEDPPNAVTMTGDGTFTTAWQPVEPDVGLYDDDRPQVRWSASATRPNSYDVASYTLDYTYYVPADG